jgi:hypothetical protein
MIALLVAIFYVWALVKIWRAFNAALVRTKRTWRKTFGRHVAPRSPRCRADRRHAPNMVERWSHLRQTG